MSDSVLLLDVMSTLVRDPFYDDVPAHFGMTLPELYDIKHPTAWIDFEHGAIDEATLLKTFFRDGREFDGQALKAVMRRGYAYLDGIEELLAELKARDVEMHALSNYPSWYQMIEDELEVSRFLSWRFVSCHMGVRKPTREAYTKPAAALGRDVADCIFVDDKKRNCQGARAVGMRTVKFDDAGQLREALVDLRVLD